MPPRLTAYHLREREACYPALIEDGKLKATHAATSLELARVIIARWAWAIDLAGTIDPPWSAARGVYARVWISVQTISRDTYGRRIDVTYQRA